MPASSLRGKTPRGPLAGRVSPLILPPVKLERVHSVTIWGGHVPGVAFLVDVSWTVSVHGRTHDDLLSLRAGQRTPRSHRGTHGRANRGHDVVFVTMVVQPGERKSGDQRGQG